MDFIIREESDITIVNFTGELDSNTSGDAEEKANELIGGGVTKMIFNFVDLDYMSSAGLRVLLSSAKQLEAVGGELRISNLNEIVQEVFDMSGFSTILSVFGTEEEALTDF